MIKPYYESSLGKLYHGSCEDILPELEQVELVLADPPYGVDKDIWDSVFPNKETWEAIRNSLKIGGNLLLIPGEKYLPAKIELISSLFEYQWVIPWYKPNAMQFGKTGYSKHTLIWWYSIKTPIEKPKGMIDVIIACMGAKEDKNLNHPSPKPLSVIMQLLLYFNGNITLDPFLGSGTTGVACERLGRKWIGIEISEEYCEIAAKRIESEASQLKLFR